MIHEDFKSNRLLYTCASANYEVHTAKYLVESSGHRKDHDSNISHFEPRKWLIRAVFCSQNKINLQKLIKMLLKNNY